jgi:hypothetical protein
MVDYELRLECLRIAFLSEANAMEALALAEKLYVWIKNSDANSGAA